MNKLNDLQRKYSEGSITVASQLSTILRDWLSIHIRRSDKELRVHIEKLRRK
jgi:hemerythrin